MLVGILLLFICKVRKHLGYCCLTRLSFKFTIETRRKGKAISLLNFLNLFNTRDQILFFSKIVLEKWKKVSIQDLARFKLDVFQNISEITNRRTITYCSNKQNVRHELLRKIVKCRSFFINWHCPNAYHHVIK